MGSFFLCHQLQDRAVLHEGAARSSPLRVVASLFYLIFFKPMKSYNYKRIEKMRKIAMLLSEYQAAFAAVPHDAGRVAAFVSLTDALHPLNNSLQLPLRVVVEQRTAAHRRMVLELGPVLGRCNSLARTLGDDTTANTFAFYDAALRKSPALQRAMAAVTAVLDYVDQHAEEAEAFGFGAARTASLRALREQAAEHSDNSTYVTQLRRVERKKLQQLLSEAHHMLRNELDWMMADYAQAEPVLFERYRLLRQPKRGSKSNTEVFTDVSGMVTDAATGAAVEGAKVWIVNRDEEAVVTDADGYFLIDDPEPGSCQLRCMAAGYEAAGDIAFSIRQGESLQLNFSLSRQEQVA